MKMKYEFQMLGHKGKVTKLNKKERYIIVKIGDNLYRFNKTTSPGAYKDKFGNLIKINKGKVTVALPSCSQKWELD